MSESRTLREIFGRKMDEVMGTGGDCIRSFLIFTTHQTFFGGIK